MLIALPDNSAIADTVAAVLRTAPFAEHSTVSIGGLIAEWVWSVVLRVFGFAARHPAVGMVLRIMLGALLLVILLRVAYGLLARYSRPTGSRHRFEAGGGTDWWVSAEQLAAGNDFTGAAHALYLALLGIVARRGLVALHESKTTGDYLRELRRKPDKLDLPRFTDFTRSYETVIYGIGSCNHLRYTQLYALAIGIREQHGVRQ